MKSERLWRGLRTRRRLAGRSLHHRGRCRHRRPDMEMIRRETPWVVGVPVEEGGSGDPSPATAQGLTAAARAVFKFLDKEDLSGRKVAVLGVGKVGSDLVRRMVEARCQVTVADVYQPALERIKERFPDVEVRPYRRDLLGGVRPVLPVLAGRGPHRADHSHTEVHCHRRRGQQSVGDTRGCRTLVSARHRLRARLRGQRRWTDQHQRRVERLHAGEGQRSHREGLRDHLAGSWRRRGNATPPRTAPQSNWPSSESRRSETCALPPQRRNAILKARRTRRHTL